MMTGGSHETIRVAKGKRESCGLRKNGKKKDTQKNEGVIEGASKPQKHCFFFFSKGKQGHIESSKVNGDGQR